MKSLQEKCGSSTMHNETQEISQEQIKLIGLKILDEIIRICKSHEITYYACGGTLLGAVRHQGFIPWDDDIDICMKREDYTRFIELFNRYADQNYKLICMENDDSYCLTFGKVIDTRTVLYHLVERSTPGMGVFVDVFPIDGCGNSLKAARKHIRACCKLREKLGRALCLDRHESWRDELRNIQNHIIFRKKKKIYEKYKKKSMRFNSSTSNYSAFCGGYYGCREIMPTEIWRENACFTFEHISDLNGPSEWHTYLTALYGDYMKLPPENEQVTHHYSVAYYKQVKK